MTSFKYRKSNNGYSILQPQDSLGYNPMGFVMICNPKGEVLKFFSVNKYDEAVKYFDYISLSKWEKLKYWIHYKRRS